MVEMKHPGQIFSPWRKCPGQTFRGGSPRNYFLVYAACSLLQGLGGGGWWWSEVVVMGGSLGKTKE